VICYVYDSAWRMTSTNWRCSARMKRAAERSRADRTRPRAQLSERELAELAEIVARRVVAALPSDETAGSADRAGEPAAGGLLTAGEIAARLGVKPGWIYRQSRAGRIPTVKLGRYYRYQLEAIETWLAEHENAA
jgi:excisionase family DNA binding protein